MSSEPAQRVVKLFFREAIARALREEMLRDENVIVLGQDVGRFGGSYKEFVGLFEQFGAARVRDTPVAEAAMVGLGVGAAAAGMRPLVSITYMDFLMLGLDPLVNFAAKARFKTGGQLTVPMVVKTTAGAKGPGRGAFAMHRILDHGRPGTEGRRTVDARRCLRTHEVVAARIRAGRVRRPQAALPDRRRTSRRRDISCPSARR